VLSIRNKTPLAQEDLYYRVGESHALLTLTETLTQPNQLKDTTNEYTVNQLKLVFTPYGKAPKVRLVQGDKKVNIEKNT
jgi:hypothetical protein